MTVLVLILPDDITNLTELKRWVDRYGPSFIVIPAYSEISDVLATNGERWKTLDGVRLLFEDKI